jgi:hypothetical protein
MAETRRRLPRVGGERPVTPEEIRDVLADEGYSAGERKTWLKSVLTDIQDGDGRVAEDLIEEINAVIEEDDDEAGRPQSAGKPRHPNQRG